MSEQTPFGSLSFADNPEPRCPCILLLDVSGSMQGEPISALSAGLADYRDQVAADGLASKRIEVAIVTFGGEVKVASDFTTMDLFSPPPLSAGGDTLMGAAINQAIDMLEARKAQYRGNGVSFYRPWVFLITDGAPTDDWRPAASRIRAGEEKKQFMFFAVGVEGANFETLRQISVRDPLKLKGLDFRKLFQWLSNSQKAVSRSRVNDQVPLPDPTGANGWGIAG